MMCMCASAQIDKTIYTHYGKCGDDAVWAFDGYTLFITRENEKVLFATIADYDAKSNLAPWVKKGLKVKGLKIDQSITRIGSCAFANCKDLISVEFMGTMVSEIGWGAFLNCTHLRNFSMPVSVNKIGTIAFANCTSLNSVKIPSQCRVDDQAFLSCTNLASIEVAKNASLGHYVFATEVKVGEQVRHALCQSEVRSLPANVTIANCHEFGFSKESVEKLMINPDRETEDVATSLVDSLIPQSYATRSDYYALVIGNQDYRFVPNVPYAIHDARIFAEYCKQTLAIPAENIHVCENATKQMIMEDEFDWLREIADREQKNLIVYYAGHGVPDIQDHNKAYMLPTDVRGTKPQRGIALDDLYATIGDLAFNKVTVFMDACFSGINRNNESVNEGLRGVEIDAEEGTLSSGNIVVFAAAKGNETAQGYLEQGHGLFTYYLLKALQESEGMITYGQLADELHENVTKTAPKLKLRKKQTPTTAATSENWRNIGL